MYTVFIEYKIDPEKRSFYLKEMRDKLPYLNERFLNYQWVEGDEQENLFVETYQTSDLEYYELHKQDRLFSKDWAFLDEAIIGGRDKLHIWRFKPVKN